MDLVLNARDTPFSMKTTALLTAQLDQTTMEKLVSPVLLPKDGMELNVLTGVTLAEFGMLLLKAVSVHLDSSGMDMLVLSVQVVKLGMLTARAVNVQSHPPGTESPVSSVLEVESTTTLPLNANAQAANHTTDTFAPLTVQQANSTTKL